MSATSGREWADQDMTDEQLLIATQTFETKQPVMPLQVPPSQTDSQNTEKVPSVNLTQSGRVRVSRVAPSSTVRDIIQGSKTSLVAVAAKVPVPRQQTSITPATSPDQEQETNVCLPAGLKKTLPKADHQWIAKALFSWTKKGGVELNGSILDRL
ncbi:hypothetical protein DPMN_090524 [Dreissena polymorpha]|uniref:Uncharacterized protein n=1 Tax=Dreissena polymorpha TaxID=45954 RepID=A0A9D4KXV7_DREPO|nr:hypothetical protein DPMN_090524 [Dreissena polymorpha]